MFGCGAVQPGRAVLGLDEEASSNRNSDHGVLGVVKIVVSHPAPDVLKVAVGLGRDVEEHGSCHTGAGDAGELGAVRQGEL